MDTNEERPFTPMTPAELWELCTRKRPQPQVWRTTRDAEGKTIVTYNGHEAGEPQALWFPAPCAARSQELIGTLASARDRWRTARGLASEASDADAPKVTDNGTERAMHDRLVSPSFGLHLEFGPGHILTTSGSLAVFWNGERARLVRHENITPLRVVLDGPTERPPTRRQRALAAAAHAD